MTLSRGSKAVSQAENQPGWHLTDMQSGKRRRVSYT